MYLGVTTDEETALGGVDLVAAEGVNLQLLLARRAQKM